MQRINYYGIMLLSEPSTDIKKIIQHNTPYFVHLRQQIHSYPEIAYEEKITATLIAQELSKLGLEVQTGIAKTGVIAILDSGKPGKTVALRADMDGLPLLEETNLTYQSKRSGFMHACGHDGHIASLLLAAATLAQLKNHLRGKIKFIFQPAEEGGAGAQVMINEGVLENPKVDAIFAYHNHPGQQLGTLFTKEDCITNGNTEFTLTISGKSGHAAMPNLAIDPISIGATIVHNIPLLLRQFSNPAFPDVITVTRFNSGVANNIIPAIASLTGTMRTANSATQLQNQLAILVKTIAAAHGGQANIEFTELYPPTINTSNETKLVLTTAKKILGEHKTFAKPLPARASEDFAFFLQKIPGCYFFIGNGIDSPSCHNSKYNFNDAVLPLAAEMLCTIAMAYLNSFLKNTC